MGRTVRRPRGKRRRHELAASDASCENACASIVRRMGYSPSPFQRAVWRAAGEGRDVLCIAPTGSGKTFALALPPLSLSSGWDAGAGPRALYLVPTRELAAQVYAVCAQGMASCGLRISAVYGGESFGAQRREAEGAGMLVATPGRLLDLMGMQDKSSTPAGRAPKRPLEPLGVASVRYVAIDEADKMLSMGLRQQVEAICSAVRPARQLMFATATATAEFLALSTALQRDPLTVTPENPGGAVADGKLPVADGQESAMMDSSEATADRRYGSRPGPIESQDAAEEALLPTVPPSITQHVWVVAEHKKPRRLLRLLQSCLLYTSPSPRD